MSPANPTITAAPPMNTPRAHHCALRLANGDVVVAGGATLAGNSVEVERFSHAQQQWETLPRKERALSSQLTVTLDDGHFLLVGGSEGGASSPHVERFDPTHTTWTTAQHLNTSRFSHTVTALWPGTGKVLVVGGNHLKAGTGTVLDTAELYEVDLNRWTLLSARGQPRMSHSATLLDSGKVLIVGGYAPNQNALVSCELFDPLTGRFEAAAPLPAARMQHTATLLNNGLVMVAGGAAQPFGTDQLETYLYDPVSNGWRPGPPMLRGHKGHTATQLPDGTLLMVGHTDLPYRPSIERYDPRKNVWVLHGELDELRYAHTATLLPGGLGVLLCGGQLLTPDTAYTASCELHGGQPGYLASTAQRRGTPPDGPFENRAADHQLQA